MRVVHITGISGAGKSACSRRLAALGYAAVDTDDDVCLSRWVRRSDGAIANRPDEPSAEWLAAHDWAWDPVRYRKLVEERDIDTLYLCGGAANDGDFAFDRIVLLHIDEATMLSRLDDPARDNDFGRIGDTRELLLNWLVVVHEKYLARGAVMVDATAPLDDVVAEILRISGEEPTSAAP